jgi:ATP synthase protein I
MTLRAKAYAIAAAQFAAAAVISSGLLAFSGPGTAWSGLVGGLIAAAGSLVFAGWVARAAERSPQEFARAFYLGEALKLVLTAALFWVAIALLHAAVVPVLATYAVTLLVYWLALLPGFGGETPQRQ